MNILEVSIISQQISSKHVLCASSPLCKRHVPKLPQTLNRDSRGSGLRGSHHRSGKCVTGRGNGQRRVTDSVISTWATAQ